MAVRDAVREAQRALAACDGAYVRAVGALERARDRRDEVVAAADREVAAAQAGVDRAVAEMAGQLTCELAARVLGLPVGEVRRAVKASSEGDGQ